MHTTGLTSLRAARLLASSLLLAVAVLRCNSETDIVAGGDSSKGFTLDGKAAKNKAKAPVKRDANGNLEQDGETGGSLDTDPNAPDPSPDGSNARSADGANVAPAAPIDYPLLDYNAKGFTSCKGDSYNTTASIQTQLSEKDLMVDMLAAKLFCGGKCQKEADKQISTAIGLTRFDRTTKQQKKDAPGFVDATFAIFANSVVKERNNQTYTFDKPLPVFPWPGAKSFYTKLDKGPLSWTSHVSGTKDFTAVVEISKVSQTDTTVLIKMKLTIPEDRGGRRLYDGFPIPREATYTIDMDNRDVRQIATINWFNGTKCDNRPEATNITYKMCKKTKKGVPETFPCN